MLENSNSKNKFSNLDRLAFRNTRPVFLGLGVVKSISKKQTNVLRRSRQPSADDALSFQPISAKVISYSQERLESKESREAIYESHGIIASSTKKNN